LFRQWPAGGLRHELLDEHVLIYQQLPALAAYVASTKLPESFPERRSGEILPGERPDQCFKESDGLHVLLVAHRVMKPESGSLIVQNQSDIPQTHLLNKRFQILRV